MLQVHVSSENMCNSISTIGNPQGWGGVWGVTLAAENYVASVRSGNYLLSCLRLKPIAIFFALVCSPCRHNSLASTLHSALPLSIRLRLHSANQSRRHCLGNILNFFSSTFVFHKFLWLLYRCCSGLRFAFASVVVFLLLPAVAEIHSAVALAMCVCVCL